MAIRSPLSRWRFKEPTPGRRTYLRRAVDVPARYQPKQSWDDTYSKIADSAASSLASGIYKALLALRDRISESEIEDALAATGLNATIMAKLTVADYLPAYKAKIRAVVQRSGATAIQRLPPLAKHPATKKAAESDVATSGTFNLLDPRAVAYIDNQGANFVTNVDAVTRDAIRAIVSDGFTKGIGAPAIGRNLRAVIGLTPRYAKAVNNYYDSLRAQGVDVLKAVDMSDKYAKRALRQRAENIARTESVDASARGQHLGWEQAIDAGLLDKSRTKRTWMANPGACDLCAALDGTTTEFDGTFPGGVDMPTLHNSCRCTVGLEISDVAMATTPATPIDYPQAPELMTPAELARVPRSYDLDNDGNPLPFKLSDLQAINMHLAGMHSKTVYTDPDGNKWLFKPDTANQLSAKAELAGYTLMGHLGLAAPEAHIVTIGHESGLIQKMHSDIVSDLPADKIQTLTPEQIAQVQRHQVFDWMISQHDTNDGALLLNAAGDVVAVDKGQAFKFFGKDKLAWDYNPNPNPLMYQRMYQDYLAGKIQLDYAAIEPLLIQIETMAFSSDTIRATLDSYIEALVQAGYLQSTGPWMDNVIDRAATIHDDFKRLYDQAQAEYDRLHPKPQPQTTTPTTRAPRASKASVFQPIDDALAAEIAQHGWAGKSLFVAGADVASGNILAYEMAGVSGGRELVLEMKLRPDAEAKIMAEINKAGIGSASLASSSAPSPYDEYWGKLEKPLAYFAKEMGKTQHEAGGSQAALDVQLLADKAIESLKHSDVLLPDELETAQHYKALIETLTGHALEELEGASISQIKAWIYTTNANIGTMEPYTPPAASTAAPVAPAATAPTLTVIQSKPYQPERRNHNGALEATGGRTDLQGQTAFTIELGDGVTAIYTPHGDSNVYSKMGRLELYVKGYTGTAGEIQMTLDKLEKLHVDHQLATRLDLELVYLNKVAFRAKAEDDPTFQRDVLAKIKPGMSVADQIKLHQDYWDARMTAKMGKPQKVKSWQVYDPVPHFDGGYNRSTGVVGGDAGWAHWKSFDVWDIKKAMKGYALAHRLGSSGLLNSLTRILDSTGHLSATESRIRMGAYNPSQGMSSERDQQTGGAEYFFTRIVKDTDYNRGQLFFDPTLLLRTDTIAYESDYYGEVTPSVLSRRGTDPDTWKRYSYNSSNETIIRYGINALDQIVQINAGYDRDAVLQLFRDRGITMIGGKPIEQVVTSNG